MKRLTWFLPLLSASLAMAQTPTCNTSTHADSNGNPCTTFTTKGGQLVSNGGVYAFSVDSQDGSPPSSYQIGAVALNGFYGEGGVDTELPTDPLQVEGYVSGYGTYVLALEGGTLASFTTTQKAGASYLNYTNTYTINAGTEQTNFCNGACLYFAWHEILTVPFTYAGYTVQCGGRGSRLCPVYRMGEGQGEMSAVPFMQ